MAEALARMLDLDGRIRVVAQSDEVGATSVAVEVFDVVVIDLPVPVGPLVAKRLLLRDPATRIVALGVADERSQFASWQSAGVMGCVGRRGSLDDLVEVVLAAARGARSTREGFVTSGSSVTVSGLGRSRRGRALTAREWEIAELLTFGWSNKRIATALNIEPPTVKNHLYSIYRKLGVQSRFEVRAELANPSR